MEQIRRSVTGLEAPSEDGEMVHASRVILASSRTLFRAFLDAETMAGWRNFDGLELKFSAINACVGGGYRVRLRSNRAKLGPGLPGTLELAVSFAELAGEERIVEVISVNSDVPNLTGTLTLTTTFEPDRDGTKVTLRAQGGPAFLRARKQDDILASSLRKLALLTE